MDAWIGDLDADRCPSLSFSGDEAADPAIMGMWSFRDEAVDLVLGRDGGAGSQAPEMDAGTGDLDADAVVPGLSSGPPGIPGISQGGVGNGDVGDSLRKDDGADGGGEEDRESDDSEDDIRIVLNENSDLMGMKQNEHEDETEWIWLLLAMGTRVCRRWRTRTGARRQRRR